MSAIETKFIGPTNFKGARISVRFLDIHGGPRREFTWDDALDVAPNHDAAALAFLKMIKRANNDTSPNGTYHRAATERGYVYTPATKWNRCDW